MNHFWIPGLQARASIDCGAGAKTPMDSWSGKTLSSPKTVPSLKFPQDRRACAHQWRNEWKAEDEDGTGRLALSSALYHLFVAVIRASNKNPVGVLLETGFQT